MQRITVAPDIDAANPHPRHASILGSLLALIGAALDMRASRQRLMELDARALSDIGLSRAEAAREARRSCWSG